jgi:hypothetical protein
MQGTPLQLLGYSSDSTGCVVGCACYAHAANMHNPQYMHSNLYNVMVEGGNQTSVTLTQDAHS